MSKTLTSFSPLVSSILESSPNRVSYSSFDKLLKNVKHSYSKTLPSGCAQNTKPQFKDIDKELENNKQKEKSLSRELKEQRKTHSKTADNRKRQCFRIIKQEQSPKKQEPIVQKSRVKRKSPRIIETEPSRYPLRFKSTPMHNDPRYKAKTRQSKSKSPERCSLLGKLDHISEAFQSFRSESKSNKRRIDKTIEIRKEIDNEMHSWVDDVHRTSGMYEDHLENKRSLRIRRNNRLIDKLMFNDWKGEMRESMNEITHQILQIGPTKIWKQNHKTFMGTIDATIASISDKKS